MAAQFSQQKTALESAIQMKHSLLFMGNKGSSRSCTWSSGNNASACR